MQSCRVIHRHLRCLPHPPGKAELGPKRGGGGGGGKPFRKEESRGGRRRRCHGSREGTGRRGLNQLPLYCGFIGPRVEVTSVSGGKEGGKGREKQEGIANKPFLLLFSSLFPRNHGTFEMTLRRLRLLRLRLSLPPSKKNRGRLKREAARTGFWGIKITFFAT